MSERLSGFTVLLKCHTSHPTSPLCNSCQQLSSGVANGNNYKCIVFNTARHTHEVFFEAQPLLPSNLLHDHIERHVTRSVHLLMSFFLRLQTCHPPLVNERSRNHQTYSNLSREGHEYILTKCFLAVYPTGSFTYNNQRYAEPR